MRWSVGAGTSGGGRGVSAPAPEIVWAPQPGPQWAAIHCPIPDLFFGGQRGGGKTDFLLGDFARQESKYGKHAHGILFRRELPELDEVVKRSRQLYGEGGLGWDYHEQKKTWTAPSGATLKFRYLDRDADAAKYQGHQYTWLGIDEAGTWPSPEPIDELWATLRSAAGVPCVRRLTGNPGGVGHHWLKARYIAPALPFEQHRWQPQPDTNPHLWVHSVFIPSRLEDNQILLKNDPGYEDRIAAATHGNKALWQAWRYGNWDVIAGAFFAEWNAEQHVLQRFTPPPEWEMFGGMDAGVRAPSWLGLAVRGPEGDTVVVREWYWRAKDFFTAGQDVARDMRAIDPRELPVGYPWSAVTLWGDSSMFSDTGVGGLTQASEFQRGLDDVFGGNDRAPKLVSAATVKGPGSRRMGAALVAQMLHFDRAEDGSVPPHRRPLLRMHKRCEHLIRTLPALPVSPRDPEDVDTEAEDHPFDGLKMMLLANPPRPPERVHVDRDENLHPGFHPTGERRRPKKPLAERIKEFEHAHALRSPGLGGGFRSGVPAPQGMIPYDTT
jgi:hypothetical protein